MTQPDLLRRQAATAATLSRYRHKAFDWRSGVTCVHLARFHLKQMGHKVPTVPRFRSEFAGLRAMKTRGWENVSDMLDSMLDRISPAAMMLGDLVVLESSDGIGSIMVSADSSKLLGWREDADQMIVLDVAPHELGGAWRA